MWHRSSDVLISHEVEGELIKTLILKVKRDSLWEIDFSPSRYRGIRTITILETLTMDSIRYVLINNTIDVIIWVVEKLHINTIISTWIVNYPSCLRNLRLAFLLEVIKVIWLTILPWYFEVSIEVLNLGIRLHDLGGYEICSVINLQFIPKAHYAGASENHIKQ